MVETAARAVEAEAADEVLVERYRAGDQTALTELLRRYRGCARGKARRYFLVGGDREDVVQEGMIGLYKAIRDFSCESGASFSSFAELCVTRQVLTAIKTATRHKHAPLNTYVSFDRPTDADPQRTVGESWVVKDDADPLDLLVASDELARLRTAFDGVLSSLEVDVLQLYVDGRSYQEIADLLGRRVKPIDNAIQRIRRKLQQRVDPWRS